MLAVELWPELCLSLFAGRKMASDGAGQSSLWPGGGERQLEVVGSGGEEARPAWAATGRAL